MRTSLLTFALLLFFAVPVLSATEPTNDALAPAVSTTAVTDQAPTAELHLTEVQIRESRAADDAAIAQFPARGSFWWVVGAIVVGGVILSVLL